MMKLAEKDTMVTNTHKKSHLIFNFLNILVTMSWMAAKLQCIKYVLFLLGHPTNPHDTDNSSEQNGLPVAQVKCE